MRRLTITLILAALVLADAVWAARDFVDANSDKIEHASVAVITNEPITIAAWWYPTSLDSTDTVVSIGNSSSLGFWRIGSVTADNAFAQKQSDTGTNGSATTTATLSLNTWAHIAGVFDTDASRTIYLNGSNAVNETTSVPDSAATRTSIGIQAGNLGSPTPADGRIAEVAVWSAALTTTELAALAIGFSPRLIRPQNLVFYAPLVRDVQDRKGLALTTTGTTVVDHPRIFTGK